MSTGKKFFLKNSDWLLVYERVPAKNQLATKPAKNIAHS
jgi:hypothetical protein